MPLRSQIVTLTTDFGYQDQYVGAMKGVMLSVSPELRFIDISHGVPPQDVLAGAWILKNSAFLYPAGTVHLAVVDPGVGTPRKPVAVKIGDQFFVGPDNGIIPLVADGEPYEAYHLTNTSFWFSQRSNTFHGRDIFSPVAASIAAGAELHEVGQKMDELSMYRWAVPTSDSEGIQGWVVHIDFYGNLISNISKELFLSVTHGKPFKIYVGNVILSELSHTFGNVPDGEPAAVIGSSGMLEIIINKGNAQQMLGTEKGAPVSVLCKH